MELDSWTRSFQPGPTSDSPKDASPLHPPPKEPGSHGDDSEDGSDTNIEDGVRNILQKLTITPNTRRYFGKSSGVTLMRSALSAKSKISSDGPQGVDPERCLQRRDDFWNLRPVCF